MRKFINICIFALCATVAFTACTDDSDYRDEPGDGSGAPVKVLSRETEFDAPAGQGKIVVECDAPITVTSSDESKWVSTSVDGNVITVSVEENLSFEGRTCMLTISSGDYSTRLAVYQAGSFFEFIGPINLGVDDNESSIDFVVNTNLIADLTVTAWMPEPGTGMDSITDDESDKDGNKDENKGLIPADFITITTTENGFVATVAENKTGFIREGIIKYTYGEHKGSIPVKQYDFEQDVAGEYDFLYKTSRTSTVYQKKSAKFGREGTSYYLEIPVYKNVNYKVPVEFDEGSMSMSILANVDCGVVPESTNHVATVGLGDKFIDTGTHSIVIGWGNTAGMVAAFNYGKLTENAKDENGYEFVFKNNGNWSKRECIGISFELVSGMPVSGDTRLKTTCLNAYYPVLQRKYTK